MTTEAIVVALEERTVINKGLQHLRREGKVPAVVHDHGKPSMHVSADYRALAKVYEKAGKHHPVQLTLGGKQHLALIKDAHFEPVKHRLQHIVFQAIKQNEKVTAEIPVVLVGDEIPAEKASLIVLTHLDVVEVEALPRDLPDQLTVDATTLAEVGDRLTVADIKVPAGVAVSVDPEHVIATVEMPKDQIAEANAAAESLAADAGTGEATEAATETDTETNEAEKEEK
jgi:large subunit ribosomal protein L25